MYVMVIKRFAVSVYFAECLSGILQMFILNDSCTTNISSIKALNNIQQYCYPHNADFEPGQTYIFYVKDDIHSLVKTLNDNKLCSREIDNVLKNLLYTKKYAEVLKLLKNFKSKYKEKEFDLYFSSVVYLDAIMLKDGTMYDY